MCFCMGLMSLLCVGAKKTVYKTSGQCSLNLIDVKILFDAGLRQAHTGIHKKIVTSGTNAELKYRFCLLKQHIVRLFSYNNTMPNP